MKRYSVLALAMAGLLAAVRPLCAQVAVDYEKYPDFSPTIKADNSLLPVKSRSTEELPPYVNNAKTKYFPPVFQQAGGSCGSASRIGYMFTYEMNAMRDADASLPENQYPTHFTWLLTNGHSGKEGMAVANGIPNSVVYGGTTYSELFGIQNDTDQDFGWMQGYDKWYSAMFNRIERNGNFPLHVGTEEGREAVKRWLYNHNGDTRFKAGGICGIGVASGSMDQRRFSQRENLDIYEDYAATHYVHNWGPQVDHALTIVGYDDRIKFDLDEDSVFGEEGEVGAWIVVNSWGPIWCSNGFIYCPYSKATPSINDPTGFYQPEVYYARHNYRPLRTYKILMEYSKRSEIKLSAGISQDINASEPEKILEFEHFRYAGDGLNSTDAPAVPMLGRWADEQLHHEPMEFGYDLTDFSAEFDTRRPLKYFFIIETKANASGTGKIHSCSLMDYEFDTDGIENIFDTGVDGVSIKNKGEKTIISVVVPGEPLNAPRNLVASENTIRWEAPAASHYVHSGYNIYCNNELLATVGTDILSYNVTEKGQYQVAAVYSIGEEDFLSTRTDAPMTAFDGSVPALNYARDFSEAGFTINNLFPTKISQATIEYWIRPTSTANWNQQIGPGWGNFLCHTTSSAEFVFGWSQSQRFTSPKNTLTRNEWQHIAIVINGKNMKAYRNGVLLGEVSNGPDGIGGFGDFTFGSNDNLINGRLDEVRIWNTARTPQQINALMYSEIADPVNADGLLCEFRMEDVFGVAPTDATGKYTTTIINNIYQDKIEAFDLFDDSRKFTANFTLPASPYYVGQGIRVENTSSAHAIRYEWINSEKPGDTLNVFEPVFVFATPGEKTITLKAFASSGKTATKELTINVEAQSAPTPEFTVPAAVTVGKRVTFVNTTSPLDACSYEWTMTGANVEAATTINASTSYPAAGEYTVTLKATNAIGSTTISQKIRVANAAPLAAFEVNPMNLLKGGTVSLIDKSENIPTNWRWEVMNAAHHNVYEEQAPTITFNSAGVYNVKLTVGNSLGTNTLEKKNFITVSNADSKNGLNFSGNANGAVTFNNPINLSKTGAFTFDWWMYANGSTTESNHIGGSAADLLLVTTPSGALSVKMKNMTFSTEAGVILNAGWHHYAAAFRQGTDPNSGMAKVFVDVYRDGHHVSTVSIPGTFPTLPGQLQFGSSSAPMKAILDEFKIWNKHMSVEDVLKYANQPIEDIEAAKAEDYLALYYNFNEGSGNVTDLTGNGNTGVRSGFGPDGDAWPSSIGVFCLSDVSREDVSGDFLTNYTMPFLYMDESVNASADQFKRVAYSSTTSRWRTENANVSNGITTGVCVDTKSENMLAIATKLYNFAGSVNDHKFYQRLTLPPGHYVFGAEAEETPSSTNDYVVAALGTTLPATANLRTEALAYATTTEGEISFSLYDDTQVALGLLLNTTGETVQHFRRFYLERKMTNEEFKETSINAPTSDTSLEVSAKDGGIVIKSVNPVSVNVYSVNGVCVYSGVVCGARYVSLPAGVYIVGEKKLIVG